MPSTSDCQPFRAEQIGSLIRPRGLVEARDAFEAGKILRGRLAEIEDRCIRAAVASQERIGLRSITDGEYRRRNYLADFLQGLDGVRMNEPKPAGEGRDGYVSHLPLITVTGKVRWLGPITVADFEFLRPLTQGRPKITIPAPTQIHFFAGRDGIDRAAYPDLDAFWDDIVAAYRSEISALATAGCKFVQIDETCLAKLCDPAVRERMEARGDHFDELVATYTSVLDRIVSGHSGAIGIGMHMCRGNFQGKWEATGGYEPIAEAAFQKVGVNAYFMEFDDARAGGFAPLRHLPKHKVVVLGLVSTKERALESRDLLKRRIDEAAAHVQHERLCLSAQCGFSGVYKGHPLTLDDQTRKLNLLVQTAREVWSDA